MYVGNDCAHKTNGDHRHALNEIAPLINTNTMESQSIDLLTNSIKKYSIVWRHDLRFAMLMLLTCTIFNGDSIAKRNRTRMEN